MRITEGQLRRIIREMVEETLMHRADAEYVKSGGALPIDGTIIGQTGDRVSLDLGMYLGGPYKGIKIPGAIDEKGKFVAAHYEKFQNLFSDTERPRVQGPAFKIIERV